MNDNRDIQESVERITQFVAEGNILGPNWEHHKRLRVPLDKVLMVYAAIPNEVWIQSAKNLRAQIDEVNSICPGLFPEDR